MNLEFYPTLTYLRIQKLTEACYFNPHCIGKAIIVSALKQLFNVNSSKRSRSKGQCPEFGYSHYSYTLLTQISSYVINRCCLNPIISLNSPAISDYNNEIN